MPDSGIQYAALTYSKIGGAIGSVSNLSINQSNQGSAFFIREQDSLYAITAAHVLPENLRKGTEVVIAYRTKESGFIANKWQLLGASKYVDVAVLIPSSPLRENDTPSFMTFAEKVPAIGDISFTLGNPLGMDHASISEGVVRDNAFFYKNNVRSINTSSQSHSGSSGGPITNREGEVIGMVSVGPSEFESLSWGVSSLIMLPIIRSIIHKKEDFKVGDVDARLQTPTPLYAITNNLPSLNGVLVSDNTNPSLKNGDFIVKVNGENIGFSDSLGHGVVVLSAGKNLSFTVHRDGKLLDINVSCRVINDRFDTILGL